MGGEVCAVLDVGTHDSSTELPLKVDPPCCKIRIKSKIELYVNFELSVKNLLNIVFDNGDYFCVTTSPPFRPPSLHKAIFVHFVSRDLL